MVHKYQMIHNQVIPKAHQHGVSSCALHQYDLNGSATSMLHYHYQLCIFWLQHYEYVYHYYRDSSKIDHSSRVHDHKSVGEHRNFKKTPTHTHDHGDA